ncbi:MAG: TfoX/Sxy family protein [Nocardioides sp.]
MVYDEGLAARIRAVLEGEPGLTEQRMFGGLAFLVGGHLAASASSRGGMLLRVDPARTEELLDPPDVDRFEMRGRGMDGWLHVLPGAVADDEALAAWVGLGVDHARSLPPR